MREDDILECECGSTEFQISRDGLIECASCKHPCDSVIAVEFDVRGWLAERGVAVVDPEAKAH